MDFKTHLSKYLSNEMITKLLASFDEEEKKALLLNTSKLSKEAFINEFPNVTPHPVVENGFLYNKNEYEFGKHIYHDLGAYYIQEPSAMIVADLLDYGEGDLVLDICAAPGGKTTGIALKSKGKGQIIANDLSKSRAITLLSNVERMGLSNVIVTSLDFSRIYKSYENTFTKIILDAPCSGSGMFRKSDLMKDDWTYEKVLRCAEIQKELISYAYFMLKPGGEMIYSTCSYSYEEDEEVIKHLLSTTDAILETLPTIEGAYLSDDNHSIHLFPSMFNGEGHFIAKIRKPGELIKYKDNKNIFTRNVLSKSGKKEIEEYELNLSIDKRLLDLSLRPGLFVDTIKDGKKVISHHYSHVENNYKYKYEINIDDAIKFIRGESLRISDKLENEFYIVTYKKMAIGIPHFVDGQLKNLYPKGLRRNIN